MALNARLHHTLCEAFTDPQEAERSALADWEHDISYDEGACENEEGEICMSFDGFVRSMWELADVWTDEIIDEEVYTAFLWKMCVRVSPLRRAP